MKLSKYFILAELTPSSTAKRLGIKNDPTPEHLESLKILAVNVLDKVREHFDKPIWVSSGYRSKALNDATPGSSPTSQHCLGEAADIDCNELNPDIFKYIKEHLEFDQLIWEFGTDAEPDWVHVSFSKDRKRKQVLKAVKVKGKTQYIPYV